MHLSIQESTMKLNAAENKPIDTTSNTHLTLIGGENIGHVFLDTRPVPVAVLASSSIPECSPYHFSCSKHRLWCFFLSCCLVGSKYHGMKCLCITLTPQAIVRNWPLNIAAIAKNAIAIVRK